MNSPLKKGKLGFKVGWGSYLHCHGVLSCDKCETGPVTLGAAPSRQDGGTDWKQIGTFSLGKMLLILIYSEYIETKKCKEWQLPQLCYCFIPGDRKTATWKWRTGQSLAAGGSVHLGIQKHSQL